MIFEQLENLPQYLPLAKGFEKAFAFLVRPDLNLLTAGRHEIDGELVYAMVYRNVGRSREGARLETHREYIDIQLVLAGLDNIGWKSLVQCSRPDGGYIEQRDVQLYLDDPDIWLPVKPGMFAIFFPEDAHMPLISRELSDKIVVKVALSQW